MAIVFFTCFCYIEAMSIDKLNFNTPYRFGQFKSSEQFITPVFKGQEPSKTVKAMSIIGSTLGTGIALALISKRQGFSLKKIKQTPIKDWVIFKIDNKKRAPLKIEEAEILTLATGSILGGFLAGNLVDKDNSKAKRHEALTQLVGNVLTPVAFVSLTSKIYNNYENKITAIMPQFKTQGQKILKLTNKFLKNIPIVTMTTLALIAGIKTGNVITNTINEKIFGQTQKRNLKKTDFAPHVDDLSLAITLMGSKSKLTNFVTRTVPVFLTVPGYQVGKAQN